MSSFNKKYQIFISSTYTDLKEERDEVMKAILTHYHIPIGMEMFSADNEEQWETIKDTIDSSDYYVLIIGHRYGSLDHDGVGFTEKEFLYAKRQGIPVLVFVRNRDRATTPTQRDTDPVLNEKLNQFIEVSKKNRLVSFWEDKVDLSLKVMQSLLKVSSKNDRVGWVRADSIPNPNEVLAEMALLQKENREMKAELNGLRVLRSPILDVTVNGTKEINMSISASEFGASSFIKLNDPNFKRGHFVNLNEYNKMVTLHKTVAEEYNKLKLDYWLNNSYKMFDFEVVNRGNSKATDVQVTLTFPPSINMLIESRDGVPQFEPDRVLAEYDNIRQMTPSIDHLLQTTVNKLPYVRSINTSYSLSKTKENVVTIRIADILHTNKVTVNRIFISGNGKPLSDFVKVSIICEEMPDAYENQIPLFYEFVDDMNLVDIDSQYKVLTAALKVI